MSAFSLWHWTVGGLGVSILAVSLIIWGHWRNRENYPDKLKGFGGWLLITSVGIWLLPWATLAIDRVLVTADMPEPHLIAVVLSLLLVICQIIQIVMMTKRSWRFPPMFIFSSIYAMMILPLSGLWMVSYLYMAQNVAWEVSAKLYAEEFLGV